MFAPKSTVFAYRHSTLPVFASTDTTPLRRNVTYCFTPPASSGTIEEYSAESFPSTGAFQSTSPVFLLSATSVASLPPGLQITLSPSTKTDSVYDQLIMSVPTLPAKSLARSFVHFTLPSVPRQHSSPADARQYRRSPLTVGVERVPG